MCSGVSPRDFLGDRLRALRSTTGYGPELSLPGTSWGSSPSLRLYSLSGWGERYYVWSSGWYSGVTRIWHTLNIPRALVQHGGQGPEGLNS